ncbi:MAG: glycosyltransferase [Bacteroidota bacterium]|nr:glycosyltransferase [Bacteroidota bacterium]
MNTIKALFLTHKEYLHSEITGGVQLCSQEFHFIIRNAGDVSLEDYYIPYTRNLLQRAMIKSKMENYSVFDIKRDAPALLAYMEQLAIQAVFINMASAVRFARPIREKFGDSVKIILLSHGNHSCDFLHLITKPVARPSLLRSWLNRVRLGNLIATEAEYRVKWLDGVVALSETEKQIENWFGAKKASFLPRRLYKDFLMWKPVPGRIGFVGRLDHPPNLQGISILLEELSKQHQGLQFRLVGAPPEYGMKIKKQFPFVEYLGELKDKDLESEVATWAFFLNPVWWYSTGASTKLARAISWGLPIITTTAGMRGYEWKKGTLQVADSPAEMAACIVQEANSMERLNHWKNQTELIAENGPDQMELSGRIRQIYE